MSCDKWFYRSDICDGNVCVGDCDLCSIPKNPPEDMTDDEEDEEKMQIIAARRGEE